MMNNLLYVYLYFLYKNVQESIQKYARKCTNQNRKVYRTLQNSFDLHYEFSHLREKR